MSSDPELLFATAPSGARIALHEHARHGTYREAVVLTHGTFSDGRVCSRLARSLSLRGFASYVLEWRGHGQSGPAHEGGNFESTALEDLPAALARIRERTQLRRVLWVGHSGGGFLPIMLMARQPETRELFAGVVSMATQAADTGRGPRARLGIAASAALTNLLRRAPGRALKLGPRDETPRMMNQWYRWNWTRRWSGDDGFDYRTHAAQINVPILALAGGGDRFVAPPEACRRFVDAIGSDDKRFLVCSRATGYAEDYDHARLLASRGAVREVWPLVTRWLQEHATSSEPPHDDASLSEQRTGRS